MEISVKKATFLEALEKTYGNISAATDLCMVNGKPLIGRTTHYHWLETDPEYAAAVEAISERRIDIVEDAAFKLAQGVTIQKTKYDGTTEVYEEPPHAATVMFLLETKGKRRGYVKKSEVDQKSVTDQTIRLILGSDDNDTEPPSKASEQANQTEETV